MKDIPFTKIKISDDQMLTMVIKEFENAITADDCSDSDRMLHRWLVELKKNRFQVNILKEVLHNACDGCMFNESKIKGLDDKQIAERIQEYKK